MIRTAAVHSTTRRSVLLAAAGASAGLVSGCAGTPVRLPVTGTERPPDLAFTMPDGAVLPARRWLPPGGQPPKRAALLLHGMNDSRDWLDIPGPTLAAAGWAVYAPDQRGFGGAPGRGTWPGVAPLVNDVPELLRQVRARHPGLPLLLGGESMGGAVCMVATAGADAEGADAVVLLSPAVWGRAQIGFVLSTGLWLAAAVAPGYRATGREVPVAVTASDNREALLALVRNPLTIRSTRMDAVSGLVDLMDAAQAAAPRLGGRRVLALYGGRDMLVPADATAAAWRAMPGEVRRAMYPRGYHLLTRDLNRAAPVGDMVAWADDGNGLLPSGADFAAAAWQATHG